MGNDTTLKSKRLFSIGFIALLPLVANKCPSGSDGGYGASTGRQIEYSVTSSSTKADVGWIDEKGNLRHHKGVTPPWSFKFYIADNTSAALLVHVQPVGHGSARCWIKVDGHTVASGITKLQSFGRPQAGCAFSLPGINKGQN